MSGLLHLADDFVERMMNPAFGPLVNEDYAMRIGELLSDERSLNLILDEARQLDRVDELSAHTWVWLLSLPGRISPVSPELLGRLCQQFRSAAFRATVIDSALRDLPVIEQGEVVDFDEPPRIESIERNWLASIVRAVVQEPESITDPVDYGDAQSLLVALLSVDYRECLEAAAALLGHRWSGQEHLLEFFESRTVAMDPESRVLWQRFIPRAADES